MTKVPLDVISWICPPVEKVTPPSASAGYLHNPAPEYPSIAEEEGWSIATGAEQAALRVMIGKLGGLVHDPGVDGAEEERRPGEMPVGKLRADGERLCLRVCRDAGRALCPRG